jgi:hypothetical protein
MTLRETLAAAKPHQWLMTIDAPKAHYLMTGMERAGIRADGLVKARYTDGTQKKAPATPAMLDAPAEEFTLLAVASHFSP